MPAYTGEPFDMMGRHDWHNRRYRGIYFGTEYNRRKVHGGWKMDALRSYSGSQSLWLAPGASYVVEYACKLGAVSVTVWVWANRSTNAWLKVLNEGGDIVAEANNVGVGAWEQLTASFVAVEAMYFVKLANRNKALDGDSHVWFDDLV